MTEAVCSANQWTGWFQFDNGLRHERVNYYSMLHKYSIVQNFKEPMKATETAADIVL